MSTTSGLRAKERRAHGGMAEDLESLMKNSLLALKYIID